MTMYMGYNNKAYQLTMFMMHTEMKARAEELLWWE